MRFSQEQYQKTVVLAQARTQGWLNEMRLTLWILACARMTSSNYRVCACVHPRSMAWAQSDRACGVPI